MVSTIPTDAEMLATVENFCAKRALAPSTFGRLSVGDGNLVANLKAGRSLTLRQANRVADFMATYRGPTPSTEIAA